MNLPCSHYTSIYKKQIVALSGLFLIGYVIIHLLGNLLVFGGPERFNEYAKKLVSLRPGLYIIELGLFFIFIIHIYFTYLVIIENLTARGQRYRIITPVGQRSLATRLMPYTGTILFAFVIWHVIDFTLTDHQGPRSIMPNGESLGLYGVVYHSFGHPWHSAGYILAMVALGFHLSHAIQSCFQTFGFNHPVYTALIRRLSNGLGVLIATALSTIPIYILFDSIRNK